MSDADAEVELCESTNHLVYQLWSLYVLDTVDEHSVTLREYLQIESKNDKYLATLNPSGPSASLGDHSKADFFAENLRDQVRRTL